ncbi:MAG TPA: pilus assembly protein N-terminal domain-containing protein, partial [Bryobacteraceae bacterium]
MSPLYRIPVISLCAFSLTAFSNHALRAQTPQSPSEASRQDSSRELSVGVGKTAVIDFTHPVTRVAVGLGDIAEVNAVSPNEVLVNGKAPGNTSLVVWESGGVRHFFNVAVHPSRFAADDSLIGLRRELNN